MARVLTGKRALRRRMKDVQRELSAVRSDIRALEKGKPVTRRQPLAQPRRRVSRPALEYPVPGIAPSNEESVDDVASLLEAEKRLPRQPLDESRLAQEDRAVKERAKHVRDGRFSDYLASSFAAGDSLRYERRVQRNKAIVLAVVVVGVLIWVLRHLLG